MTERLVEVAVFAPLRQNFLYRVPVEVSPRKLQAGVAVRVPFGKSTRIGIIVDSAPRNQTFSGKIKPVTEVCAESPLFKPDELALARWASSYYHYPLGETFAVMLPTKIRRSGVVPTQTITTWRLNKHVGDTVSPRAKRQWQLISLFAEGEEKNEADFANLTFDWRRPLKELMARGVITQTTEQHRTPSIAIKPLTQQQTPLNTEQQNIVDTLAGSANQFSATLLHGVTGSGKTNVYIALIAKLLNHNGQALVLLPEIAITQQLVERFEGRFGELVAVTHSGLSDKQRATVWTAFRRGQTRILLGTRSAVWVGAPHLSCIIVDEEHDQSYKQQEGFRYNARDIAVYRASRLKIPVLLGSATPSFETYRNAISGKYRLLTLSQRAAGATLPQIQIEDIRGLSLQSGLSPKLIAAIRQRLEKNQQTILFLNRRGYAPVMLCHQCGALWECDRCDSKLVLHRERGVLICHQCDKRVSVNKSPACCVTPEMIPLGQGTEQLAENLTVLFPEAVVRRIDRDTVRKKIELDEILSQARNGEIDILLGTQMLAKGHDFPNVSLVGIVDADARLFSLDFRAEERLAQMVVQVAGRAGRASIAGEVLIQTRQPFHRLFKTLLDGDYTKYLELGLDERRATDLPPYTLSALIRAEAVNRDAPYRFLAKLIDAVKNANSGISIFGPIPSQLERRAGKFRAEIVIFASTHQRLAAAVEQVIRRAELAPEKSSVRWSVDIDPQET